MTTPQKLATTLLIFAFVVLTMFLFAMKQAIGEETSPLLPDKQTYSIVGSDGVAKEEHHIYEWTDEATTTVSMTSHVAKSECASCLEYMPISDCIKYFNICD